MVLNVERLAFIIDLGANAYAAAQCVRRLHNCVGWCAPFQLGGQPNSRRFFWAESGGHINTRSIALWTKKPPGGGCPRLVAGAYFVIWIKPQDLKIGIKSESKDAVFSTGACAVNFVVWTNIRGAFYF